MKLGWRALPLLVLLAPFLAHGDAGILIPSNRSGPDPSVLSLEEMAIDISIDNGIARVRVEQIFASHDGTALEGTYVFALPGEATVSNFAVWDGVTRIPGVIVERRRAQEIYEDLRWQYIDPGLLQIGERGPEEARRGAVFNVKVQPIPAYGTKRIEIEYHQRIPVENLASRFAVPLRPDAYHAQRAGRLRIALELRSEHPLRDFAIVSRAYPMDPQERTSHWARATFEGRDVDLVEDFVVEYALEAEGDVLNVLTHRDPSTPAPSPTETIPEPTEPQPGFFQASLLLAPTAAQPATPGTSQTLTILFDTSLSMQWEKLERSFQALETLLRSLSPTDRFNLMLFNTEVNSFAPAPVQAAPETIEQALEFVRRSRLRGGTDVQGALGQALAQPVAAGSEAYLVLLSDGGATNGIIDNGRLAAWYDRKWNELPPARRPRTYVFAVGDDANLPLLRLLARANGVIEWVRSTEPIEFKLNAFLSKIGRRPVEQLQLTASPASNFDFVYPLEENSFSGSTASWVGQYQQPAPQAVFTASGQRNGTRFAVQTTVPLPEESLDHPALPRLWARARVDALLERIEREGEDQATIDEIIRLARKYNLVTPYTSFLAVPRALLRPRVIRPGDPLLRVKTDESIVSVVALFPFGLIKELRYLSQEDIWQTRFLAPTDLPDGTHQVRLILRDREGRVYRETKSFIILSNPPPVRVRLEKKRYRRGEIVKLRVSASEMTRTIVARLYGVTPVNLHWDPRAGYNTGELVIPEHLSAGSYVIKVIAEDFAHNIGRGEVTIEVVP
ncbi:MAG: VIT and VWA domain-containing protein [Terriglobia bacterium]